MITFGTLLWIDEVNHSAINNKNKSIYSYFRQVDLLAKTLRSVFNSELVVFTNNQQMIAAWFSVKGKSLPGIIQITPSISVPAGFKFYGAHFKVDALLAGINLIESDNDRFFLLDTDVIANRKFNAQQLARISSADIVGYDISDQVFPVYGAEKIQGDIELIAGESFVDPKWFGGEFVGGNRKGLGRLVEKAQQLLPIYFKYAGRLHHVGDEMFITSALNKLIREGDLRIINQGPYRLMSRHWSRHTDRSLRYHMEHNFVHCPGSKPMLEFLSKFKNPKHPYIYLCLRWYQFAVLFYQYCKLLIK
jgi:hypothetical protein